MFSFDGVFLLVAFHYIALVCNYCFLLWIIKYLSIPSPQEHRPRSLSALWAAIIGLSGLRRQNSLDPLDVCRQLAHCRQSILKI